MTEVVAPSTVGITIDRRRVVVVLLGVVALLNVANAACIALGADSEATRYWLLSLERNPSTWFAASLLAVTGVAAFAVGLGRADCGRWTAVAVVLGLLSFDEIATVHERLSVLPAIPGIGSRGWAGAGLLLVVAVTLYFGRWVLDLEPPLRFALLLGGAVFVLGAVGFEVLSGNRAAGHGEDAVQLVLATIEEDLELLGPMLVLRALLDRLAAAGTPVVVQVSTS